MSVFCPAVLNYLPRNGDSAMEVEILDGRATRLPGWRDCGFELVGHSSAVKDWFDDAEIAAVHYPEIEDLARAMTGADVALVSGHIRRSPEDAQRHHQL